MGRRNRKPKQATPGRASSPKSPRIAAWTAIRRRLSALLRAPADTLGPALLLGFLVTVIGGMLVAFFVVVLDFDGERAERGDRTATSEKTAADGAPCEPAIDFKGYNEDPLPAGAVAQGPPPAGTYNGQIEGGDILRVRSSGQKDFSDSVTVRPGAVVTVGLRLSNPGGTVGDVVARVALPRTADNALDLRARVGFEGTTGAQAVADTASILVEPSGARGCARYVAGSSTERVGSGTPRDPTLDWITSDGGAYFGSIGDRIDEVTFLYFKVVVI